MLQHAVHLLAALAVTFSCLPVAEAALDSAHESRKDLSCVEAYLQRRWRFQELSGMMREDFGWDILQRNGNPAVCLGEGHRFFFVLFIYQHWRTQSTTADFGLCLPRECDGYADGEQIILRMYQHFFDHHTDYMPDGSVDHDSTVHYSLTLKEYSAGLVFDGGIGNLSESFAVVAVLLMLPMLATVCDEARHPVAVFRTAWHRWRGAESCTELASSIRTPLLPAAGRLMKIVSMRAAVGDLMSPVRGESINISRLRASLTALLVLLHVTEGSKWHSMQQLERNHPLFVAVRPLVLVNDAFVLLSAYLCAQGHKNKRAEMQCAGRGILHRTTAASRCVASRCIRKYVRQLPLCLFWAWVYVRLLPLLPYNVFNHRYPWFGIRWYQKTNLCSVNEFRYAFLLGDVASFALNDWSAAWAHHHGNPCANLCNFQLEIETFAVAACLVAMPRWSGTAALVAVIAVSSSVGVDDSNQSTWLAYHLRGVAMLLLFLRVVGLPHAKQPPPSWRFALCPGFALVVAAVALQGMTRGSWFSSLLPRASRLVLGSEPVAVATYQMCFAAGLALIFESSRASHTREYDSTTRASVSLSCCAGGSSEDLDTVAAGSCAVPPAREKSSLHTPGATKFWAAANKLACGVNISHVFVQFYVEALSSVDARTFTLFTWLAQLLGVASLSVAVSVLTYVFVQHPYGNLFASSIDYLLTPRDRGPP